MIHPSHDPTANFIFQEDAEMTYIPWALFEHKLSGLEDNEVCIGYTRDFSAEPYMTKKAGAEHPEIQGLTALIVKRDELDRLGFIQDDNTFLRKGSK